MPELFVTEITSVGTVDAADNPGAEILFWKRRRPTAEETPTMTDRDRWAADFRKRHPDVTPAEARAAYWRAHPEAVTRHRAEQATVRKSRRRGAGPTLADRIEKAIHRRAVLDQGLPGNYSTPLPVLRAARRDTAEGRALVQLARSPFGTRPADGPIAKASAGGDWADALDVLTRWEGPPAAGNGR